MSLPFLLITADISPEFPPSPSENEHIYQFALLKMFFADVTESGREYLSQSSKKDPEDYFQWTGVYCMSGTVTRVNYFNRKLGHLNIHSLPHSVRYLRITRCSQKYILETRMLPKKLVWLYVYQNSIYGTIDLQNLPSHLEILWAQENEIRGPIDLTGLPNFFKSLDLSFNKIDQKVVLYGNLPAPIEKVRLGDQKLIWAGIQGVRAISKKDKVNEWKAKHVFCKIEHYSVMSDGD